MMSKQGIIIVGGISLGGMTLGAITLLSVPVICEFTLWISKIS